MVSMPHICVRTDGKGRGRCKLRAIKLGQLSQEGSQNGRMVVCGHSGEGRGLEEGFGS